MSRILYAQAKQSLAVMEQFYGEILLKKEQIEPETFQSILEQVQSGVIELGNKIERGYGRLELIGLYEQYCENLYQLSMENSQKDMALRIQQQALLQQIKDKVEEEITDRLEVVFLPYKSAMWDSMESLYEVAKAEADVDAYVIPIPYYDKNVQGEMETFHYEGQRFPKDLKITDYKSYSIQDRMPDFIFIHNPYDGGNHVTSVDPAYYAKTLRNCTMGLVYTPYFVGAGYTRSINTSQTAGVVYSNYVLSQSELERDAHVKHIQDLAPGLDIRDKILTLGQPQFDKARHIKEHTEVITKEWIERAKGKQVYLYNTSLSTMLHTEHYLEKLESVMAYFEGQEDKLVIWRPHPLMEATFASLRPQNLKRFQDLRQGFIQRNIGIYDDLPDGYGAIALSDVYYGDHSSMIFLSIAAGLKIVRQDCEDMTNQELRELQVAEQYKWIGNEISMPEHIGRANWVELRKRVEAMERQVYKDYI